MQNWHLKNFSTYRDSQVMTYLNTWWTEQQLFFFFCKLFTMHFFLIAKLQIIFFFILLDFVSERVGGILLPFGLNVSLMLRFWQDSKFFFFVAKVLWGHLACQPSKEFVSWYASRGAQLQYDLILGLKN